MDNTVFNFQDTHNPVSTYFSKVGSVSGHDYMKFEKGKDSKITYMTGDEYIQHCIEDIFRSDYEATVTSAIKDYKVHEYADLMKRGVQFPPIYLDYTTGNQEGRHRALAYKEAFGADAKMPVLEIFPTKTTLTELQDYCNRKYAQSGLGKQFMLGFGLRLGFTEEEIYDFLNWELPKSEPEPITNSEQPQSDDDIDELENQIAEYYNMTVEELESLPTNRYMKLVDKYLDKLLLS